MREEFGSPKDWSLVGLRAGVRLLCVFVAGLFVGCGGGSGSTVPSSPAASVSAEGTRVDAVASVAGTPIPRASYAHWRSVEARLGVSGNVGHQALAFLLTSQWVLGEAAARGLSTSEAEVKRYLAELERQQFPRAGMLRDFLSKSGETERDLLARARVELLKAHITAKVSAGSAGSQTRRVLASFDQAFRRHWKQYTTCKRAYVMEDCSEYRGKSEDLAASPSPPSHPAAPARRSWPAGTPARVSPRGAPTLNTEQEIPPARAGEMALSSPAFELNAPIPSRYTCDGAGISPPLRWRNVPANAAALVLYVIDDETRVPDGGVRWVLGDIDPRSTGVGAGQIPPGAVVGRNAQGRVGYSAICPARGATSRVEFVMYALSKRIALSTGYQPSVAEYDSQMLRLGKVAVTYGGYHRP